MFYKRLMIRVCCSCERISILAPPHLGNTSHDDPRTSSDNRCSKHTISQFVILSDPLYFLILFSFLFQ